MAQDMIRNKLAKRDLGDILMRTLSAKSLLLFFMPRPLPVKYDSTAKGGKSRGEDVKFYCGASSNKVK